MQDPAFDYDVFVSFASADERIARPLWQELTRSGLRVFWSDASLRDRAGSSWFEIIQESLGRSCHFLLIWTPASAESSWVKREYKAFFSHCYQVPTRLLVTVLAGTKADSLPLFLREVQACFLDEPDLIKRLVRLFGGVDIAALQAQLAQREEEIDTLRDERDDLAAQLADFKTRLSTETVQQQEEISSLRRERDALGLQIRDLETSAALLEERIRRSDAERSVEISAEHPERGSIRGFSVDEALLAFSGEPRGSQPALGEPQNRLEDSGPFSTVIEAPDTNILSERYVSPKSLVIVRILFAAFGVTLAILLTIADEFLGISPEFALGLGIACIAALALSWQRHPRTYLLLLLTSVAATSAAIWSNTVTIYVPEVGPGRSVGYEIYFYRAASHVFAIAAVTLLLVSREILRYFRVSDRRRVFVDAFRNEPPRPGNRTLPAILKFTVI